MRKLGSDVEKIMIERFWKRHGDRISNSGT